MIKKSSKKLYNKKCRYNNFYVLAPLRRPFSELSKAAFVMNLKAEVKAPDAAKPTKKDCKSTEKACKLYEWAKHNKLKNKLRSNKIACN